MEMIKDNIFWILFFGIILLIFVIRMVTKQPNFMRSMFESSIEVSSVENIEEIIFKVMKSVGFKDIDFDKGCEKFHATTTFSMSSWFEHIEIKLVSVGQKRQLHFSSICGYPYQIYDWGKNKQNFERFQKELIKVI